MFILTCHGTNTFRDTPWPTVTDLYIFNFWDRSLFTLISPFENCTHVGCFRSGYIVFLNLLVNLLKLMALIKSTVTASSTPHVTMNTLLDTVSWSLLALQLLASLFVHRARSYYAEAECLDYRLYCHSKPTSCWLNAGFKSIPYHFLWCCMVRTYGGLGWDLGFFFWRPGVPDGSTFNFEGLVPYAVNFELSRVARGKTM